MATHGRPSPTRVTISDNLIKVLLVIFVVPAPFEIVVGVVTRQQYDYTRLAVISGALIVLALALLLVRNRRLYVQSVIGYYLVLAGLLVAGFGVFAVFTDDVFSPGRSWSAALTTAVAALAPSIGLLLMVCGVYLVRAQLMRAREDQDTPGPASIANPRSVRVRDLTASAWRSDHFATRRGAEGILSLCTKYLDPADLHFVAYYTGENECLCYVDLLDEDALAPYDIVDVAERRRLYEQDGRHVRAVIGRLDRRFRTLDSGPLVRVVLDVKKGGIFFYSLDREGYLLGVTLDQSRVDQADAKMSRLANEILVSRGGRPNEDFMRANPAPEPMT